MLSDELTNLATAFAGQTQHEIDAFEAVLHAGDLQTARTLINHLMGILVMGEALRGALFNELRANIHHIDGHLAPAAPPKAPPRLSDFPKALDL